MLDYPIINTYTFIILHTQTEDLNFPTFEQPIAN